MTFSELIGDRVRTMTKLVQFLGLLGVDKNPIYHEDVVVVVTDFILSSPDRHSFVQQETQL